MAPAREFAHPAKVESFKETKDMRSVNLAILVKRPTTTAPRAKIHRGENASRENSTSMTLRRKSKTGHAKRALQGLTAWVVQNAPR